MMKVVLFTALLLCSNPLYAQPLGSITSPGTTAMSQLMKAAVLGNKTIRHLPQENYYTQIPMSNEVSQRRKLFLSSKAPTDEELLNKRWSGDVINAVPNDLQERWTWVSTFEKNNTSAHPSERLSFTDDNEFIIPAIAHLPHYMMLTYVYDSRGKSLFPNGIKSRAYRIENNLISYNQYITVGDCASWDNFDIRFKDGMLYIESSFNWVKDGCNTGFKGYPTASPALKSINPLAHHYFIMSSK